MLKLRIILTLMFLSTCVACSTTKTPDTSVLIKTETVLLLPPDTLLADPIKPEIKHVVTTRDILDNSDSFELAYQKAAEQIRILREWFKSQKVTK